MIISRRSFLVGLFAAPIIIRPGIIMPVKPIATEQIWLELPPGVYNATVRDVELSSKGAMKLTMEIMETLGDHHRRVVYPLRYPTDEMIKRHG